MTRIRTNRIAEVVNELIITKSIILEGPPGTGKTFQVKQIIEHLRKRIEVVSSSDQPIIRPRDPKLPFGIADMSIAQSGRGRIRTEWVTFHESFTYEEFILGRRPEPVSGGIKLSAHAGVLLDLAISVDSNFGNFDAAVLVIDEINRANAGRVFGEFMTLLDKTYRATIDGQTNSHSISPRLAGLRYEPSGLSEQITTLNGRDVQLPVDWLFPENVYVVATMNSVDKGALPMDSALLRRFKRFYIAPDHELLAHHIREDAPITDPEIVDLVCALFLRVNDFIFANLGRDHLLGHALYWDVARSGICNIRSICQMWDQVVFPQLLDRFIFNTGILNDLTHQNIESFQGLLEMQHLSDWEESDALLFFRSIIDDPKL